MFFTNRKTLKLMQTPINSKLKDLWTYSDNINEVATVYDYRHLLFVCSMYDYEFIAKAVINLTPPRALPVADIAYGSYEISLLHFASYFKADKVAKLLKGKWSHVDVIERRRRQTPLHWAAGCGHVSTVQLLLENKAKVDRLDAIKRTPLHLASENRKRDVEDILSEAEIRFGGKRTKITKLFVAAKCGDCEEITRLVESGANVEEWTDGGDLNTPLIGAAFEGHVEAVELLLNLGASIDEVDENKWSALMQATWKGHVDVVKLLLERGANVGIVGLGNWTALNLAKFQKRTDMVELLKRAANLADCGEEFVELKGQLPKLPYRCRWNTEK